MKRCQRDVVATCYTCQKKYASQKGFNSHVLKERHFPVPAEYPSFFPFDDGSDDVSAMSQTAKCSFEVKGSTKSEFAAQEII
ncbi:hypothetical protein GBAR_LOCUS20879 [Geodia barretti]|uniref:Uncharacterized protein n=1 Tax=Geodia barretti TaxID=519541 RepID=A0AA35SWE0_GEOBA|nr:hypothetical protein GBAR_LOCUS20879 [Geodia barretti]